MDPAVGSSINFIYANPQITNRGEPKEIIKCVRNVYVAVRGDVIRVTRQGKIKPTATGCKAAVCAGNPKPAAV